MFTVRVAPLSVPCARTCRKFSLQSVAVVCISIAGMIPAVSRRAGCARITRLHGNWALSGLARSPVSMNV